MSSSSVASRFYQRASYAGVAGVLLLLAFELASGQIVGGFNVGFTPQGALNLGASRVTHNGVRPQQAWFGNTGNAFNPVGTFAAPVKPFSTPQYYGVNRPLITSMDMARHEVARGLYWSAF